MADALVRRMTEEDLEDVARIEKETFPSPWSYQAFESELKNIAARYLVVELENRVIGYAGAWIILDESHITNIAISQPFRGNGYGRLLTTGLLQYLSNLGATYATLEVRVSNLRAQTLYQSLGFVTVGKRKKYYEDNREDGLIMVCDRMPPADPDFSEPETIFTENS